MTESIDAEVLDRDTGEVLPATRQMRGEVLRPEDVQISTEHALEVANELKTICANRGWVSNIQGNDYLNVEAWTFLGGKFGISASTEIEFIKDASGATVAVLARASLIDRRSGDVIATAAQTCDLGGKFRELNHAVGMAQTRAISRAYQQQFRWIAKMAGYEGTPAEEMDGVETRRAAPAKRPAGSDYEPPDLDTQIKFGQFKGETWRACGRAAAKNPGGRHYGWLKWLSEQPLKDGPYRESNRIQREMVAWILGKIDARAKDDDPVMRCPECEYEYPAHADGCENAAADEAF